MNVVEFLNSQFSFTESSSNSQSSEEDVADEENEAPAKKRLNDSPISADNSSQDSEKTIVDNEWLLNKGILKHILIG